MSHSRISIPRPAIHTGPKHLTVDEATTSYLREAAARVRSNRYWGSGVTALVSSVLDSVADALATPSVRGSNDPKPPLPPGDDPRAGHLIPGLLSDAAGWKRTAKEYEGQIEELAEIIAKAKTVELQRTLERVEEVLARRKAQLRQSDRDSHRGYVRLDELDEAIHGE